MSSVPFSSENRFPHALRRTRLVRGLAQEEFDGVSGRTYISALELGKKSPTLNKIDQLATPLGVHPLTLLALAYINEDADGSSGLSALLTVVAQEAEAILENPCQRMSLTPHVA